FPLHCIKLINLYHQNYKEIDRTVLVFDKKPHYSIIKNPSDIQILVSNCLIKDNIKNIRLRNNNVLKSLKIQRKKNQTTIIIRLNKSNQTAKDRTYNLESFEVKGKNYKLILDIFNILEPKTIDEHLSYANFYKSVGFLNKANKHLKIAESLKAPQDVFIEQIKVEEIEDEASEITQKPSQELIDEEIKQKTPFSEIMSYIQKLVKRINLKNSLPFLIIILVIIVVIMIILNIKRPKTKQKRSLHHTTEGFGSYEFKKKMISKLSEQGWQDEEIAKEMKLTEEQVKNIYMS
ncbi:MAG: hypothetical protein KAT74_09940, partial [Candidatus Cloacimonetes bacterium]|nr:hypothetical protein [Candidatus Cloacimonadota bacterium]